MGMEKRTDYVIEKEGKENVNDVKLETGSNDEKEIKTADLIMQEEKEDNIEIDTDAVVEKKEIYDGRDIRTYIIDEKVESTRNNDTEIKIVNVIENDEQEYVIDLNEIEVKQQAYDAEISVIDDCKNLEVGKNENIEIKKDFGIEK